jgi:hypothetical protein
MWVQVLGRTDRQHPTWLLGMRRLLESPEFLLLEGMLLWELEQVLQILETVTYL